MQEEIEIIDVTQVIGIALDKVGLGDDSNNETEISKAGIFDLCDSLNGKDNSKFSIVQAKEEMNRRGL